MALHDNELLSSHSGRRGGPAIQITKNRVGTLAAQVGAPLLPRATPLSWDSAAGMWTVYTQPSDPAVYTITADATPASAGTFQLQIDGLAMVFPFDVAAAAVQSEANAVLADAGKGYQVAAVQTAGTDLGDSNAVVTLTFDEAAGAPSVDLDASGLTGNPHVLAATDPGTQLNGTDRIRGFVDDDDGVQSHDTDEVQVLVALEGELSRHAINTAAIRAVLGGSPSEGELDAALKDPELRKLGLQVKELAGVH